MSVTESSVAIQSLYQQQREAPMPYPRQPEPPPIWICPSCQKLMRIRTIEIVNGEEQTKLACAACGTEATQTKMLSD